jgi:polyphosphate kinase 2 (PPK2 family)
MHISPDEQLKRFKRREKRPLKSWKLTDEDLRNRKKRPAYEEAVEDMLERTDHDLGRWHVIAGESKKYARMEVIQTATVAIENAMREQGMEPLDPAEIGLD